MQLNVLDDLAEAMKALDGKKRSNLRAKKDDLCGHFKIAILAQFFSDRNSGHDEAGLSPNTKGATPVLDHANLEQNKQSFRMSLAAGFFFFSVQRLHGFRQVVTHIQSQQKDEL